MTDTAAAAVEDGNYLVRVRAQVMSRDDSSGGWVPLGGGGLSNVSVRKRPRGGSGGGPESSKQKHDYLIYGKRISDECTVLRCMIKKDFEYNKVMPTFHHWKTEDKKFGLTFQTAADARAFDKGVRTAVEELLDGFADTVPPSILQYKCHKDVGDDDVFMTLNLPQEPLNSRSSSDSSSKGSEHIHRIHYTNDRQLTYDPLKEDKENYSYVQLTTVHEYNYPVVDEQKSQPCRRDSASSLKKSFDVQQIQQPSHPFKGKSAATVGGGGGVVGGGGGGGVGCGLGLEKGGVGVIPQQRVKIRCRHCHELYSEDHNPKGSCEYAPDSLKKVIDTITCIGCAQCISYHCAADAEGDFAQHPCDCSDDNCGKRWICLTFLSLFVPCLWFYPPLKICHWCGIRCGMCGGKHNMMPN